MAISYTLKGVFYFSMEILMNKHCYANNEASGNSFLVTTTEGLLFLKDKEKRLTESAILENLSQHEAERISWDAIGKIETDRDRQSLTASSKEKGESSFYKSYSFANGAELGQFQAALEEHKAGTFAKEERLRTVQSMVTGLAVKLLIASGLIFFMHNAAAEIAAGDEVTIRGRHALMKRLLFGALDLLGPIGVIVVGLVLIALIVVGFSKKMKNPNEFVVYTLQA